MYFCCGWAWPWPLEGKVFIRGKKNPPSTPPQGDCGVSEHMPIAHRGKSYLCGFHPKRTSLLTLIKYRGSVVLLSSLRVIIHDLAARRNPHDPGIHVGCPDRTFFLNTEGKKKKKGSAITSSSTVTLGRSETRQDKTKQK